MKPKVLLFSILYILSACEFEDSPGVVTYTFFELAPLGIKITTAESVQDFYTDTKLRMYFDAELLKTAEMKIEKIQRYSDLSELELNEHLLGITNAYNIREWEIESVNDGFEFVGTSFE